MPRKGWPYQWPDGTKTTKTIQKKYKSCVKKVKAKNKRVRSPYAVCTKVIKRKHKKKR